MASAKKRRTVAAWCAAVAMVTVSACGQGGGDEDRGGTGNGDDGAERVFVEAISEDPVGLHPQFAGGPIPLRFGFAIFDTLVEINDQYEISPRLARDWEFSDDNSMVTFQLEEGVTWHDGEPFTAEDVVFNVEEIMPLQTFGGPLTASIASVEAPDDHTVVVHLDSQYGPFLEALSQQVILPKHLYEGTDYVTNPHNLEPVGTGAMMFESYRPGDEIVLVRNADWWRGETQVDRAIYPIMTDANTRTLAMLNGELDVAVIDQAQQEEVSADPDLFLTEGGVFPQKIQIMFNTLLPELEDPEVRALVFSAIDREAIARLALNGLGTPADTFFPDAVAWAQHPDLSFSELYPRDLEAINEGLDAAGLPVGDDGRRFTLDMRFMSALPEVVATAEVIQASLEEVHIGVDLQGAAVQVWEEAVWEQQDFGISLARTTVGADPSIGLTRWVTCNPDTVPQNNGAGVCDEEVDSAAQAALGSLDREERAPHFHAVQERLAELSYWAPLAWYHGSYHTVNTSRWSGLDDSSGQTNSIPWDTLEWVGS